MMKEALAGATESNRVTLKRTTRYILFGFVLLGTVGCHSFSYENYWQKRGLDGMDCVSAQLGWLSGFALPVSAGVEVTPFVPIGIGGYSGPTGVSIPKGMVGRNYGYVQMASFDLPYNLFLCSWDEDGLYYGGTRYFDYKIQGWNKRRYGRVGAHLGLLPIYCSMELDAIEILDFIFGFTGFDLTGDDGSPIVHNADEPNIC